MRRSALLLVSAVAAVSLAVALASGSSAEEPRGNHIVYLHVSGEGSLAKAWYRGAPATGESVQEALDRFAKEGYRVASVTATPRPSIAVVTGGSVRETTTEASFLMLLER
jgi:hypothetical protein